MHDIKFIRQNPEAFDKGMALRNLPLRAETLLELDKQSRQQQTEHQLKLAELKSLSKKIGQLRRDGNDLEAVECSRLASSTKGQLLEIEARGEHKTKAAELQKYLEETPNIPGKATPAGTNEDDNIVISKHGTIPKFDFEPKPHEVIGEEMGQMLPEIAVKMSGSRFMLLKGDLAKMERKLGQFMLDVHTEQHGYTEVSPPFLVKDKALFGTGQLPKFEEDQFKTTTGHYLIPTAEVSLTNMVADQIIDVDELPLRYVSFNPLFPQRGRGGRARHRRFNPPTSIFQSRVSPHLHP